MRVTKDRVCGKQTNEKGNCSKEVEWKNNENYIEEGFTKVFTMQNTRLL